jgi:hypothetical protein
MRRDSKASCLSSFGAVRAKWRRFLRPHNNQTTAQTKRVNRGCSRSPTGRDLRFAPERCFDPLLRSNFAAKDRRADRSASS